MGIRPTKPDAVEGVSSAELVAYSAWRQPRHIPSTQRHWASAGHARNSSPAITYVSIQRSPEPESVAHATAQPKPPKLVGSAALFSRANLPPLEPCVGPAHIHPVQFVAQPRVHAVASTTVRKCPTGPVHSAVVKQLAAIALGVCLRGMQLAEPCALFVKKNLLFLSLPVRIIPLRKTHNKAG